MRTDNHIKYLLTTLVASIVLFVAGVMSPRLGWLMIVGIAMMALGGALLIKATWHKNDENRDKRQWSILDSRLVN